MLDAPVLMKEDVLFFVVGKAFISSYPHFLSLGLANKVLYK